MYVLSSRVYSLSGYRALTSQWRVRVALLTIGLLQGLWRANKKARA